jgi:NAD(P)H-dependent FMN reductase
MDILCISGSLRAGSSNSALVRAAATLAPEGMTFTIYESLGDLPHFSPELDDENAPASVQQLRALLRSADGVLICTPEYAHGMPGSLKNALDWTVSSGDFDGKPVAVLSASPSAMGGEKAHASLTQTLKVLGAKTSVDMSLIVPFVRTKLNAEGELTDEATASAMRSVLSSLAASA